MDISRGDLYSMETYGRYLLEGLYGEERKGEAQKYFDMYNQKKKEKINIFLFNFIILQQIFLIL
jgi:hypothetical protein